MNIRVNKLNFKIFTLAIRAITLIASALFYPNIALSAELDEKAIDTSVRQPNESIFKDPGRSLDESHFTWGAEAGASIDISGYDMSTFDVDLLIGYKNRAIRMLGAGIGVHRGIQTGDNFIPIYATIQTSFRNKPSLCFLSAKIGYSFSTISDSPMFGDIMSALGCGINLSRSRLSSSYILLSVGSRYFNNRHIENIPKIDRHYIFVTSLALGISF